MRKLGDVLYNFHWVIPGDVARSAQAYAGFLGPFLKRHGIRTIINLRGAHPKFGWWRYENRVSKALNVLHLNVMLNSRYLPLRRMLVSLFDAFDKAEHPFLIKCSGGQDRTSFASALYIVHRDGWSALKCAENQFDSFPYLHFPKPHQRWLKLFLAFAEAEAQGRPISTWISEHYEPERLREWLVKNGFDGSFEGIFALPPGGKW